MRANTTPSAPTNIPPNQKARRLVEKVGLVYVDEVYIADAVEALDICKPRHFPEAAETAKEAP